MFPDRDHFGRIFYNQVGETAAFPLILLSLRSGGRICTSFPNQGLHLFSFHNQVGVSSTAGWGQQLTCAVCSTVIRSGPQRGLVLSHQDGAACLAFHAAALPGAAMRPHAETLTCKRKILPLNQLPGRSTSAWAPHHGPRPTR